MVVVGGGGCSLGTYFPFFSTAVAGRGSDEPKGAVAPATNEPKLEERECH